MQSVAEGFSELMNKSSLFQDYWRPSVLGWWAFSSWALVALKLCLLRLLQDGMCIHKKTGDSISHGAFPGPWRHVYDVTRGQWERILCSPGPQTSSEDCRLCVLFPRPQGVICDCLPHPAVFWAQKWGFKTQAPGQTESLWSWRQIPI